ncbi:hypothetical protein DM02DRAFT_686861 [Periconia macrospinosa]|uniref:Rhodopsin domain-containing protein n=1 Tax=Periconia macrospinosa TaxID=97972 RepID=A0A2V1DFD9_9PLEO|nr:hypothetical protein DM02DRAFT_686861 [Periconia macrospinosa]
MVPHDVISLLVTNIVFTTLAFFTVVARLYTRFGILKHAGIEDYFISVSMAASFGHLAGSLFRCIEIRYGLGTPFNTVKHKSLFVKALWASVPAYYLALLFVKLSIICQYMRIFKGVTFQRTYKICKILLGVLAVYGCWTVFGSIFQCIPVQFFWGVGEGSCMNRLAFGFANAALGIATDILIFAIPIPSIKSLSMSKTKKIALGVVFSFGGFACVASIIRLKSLYTISISHDISLSAIECVIWSGIEINVGITCSSISTLKPLVRKTFPRFLSSTNRTQKAEVQVREGSERGLIRSTADCDSMNGPNPIRGDKAV